MTLEVNMPSRIGGADGDNGSAPTLDVSTLPPSALDYRSPIWWGNALLLCIETTMFALAVATYFYLRRNYHQWPPPLTDISPPVYFPLPDLKWSTINLFVLLVSVIPMIISDRACLRGAEKTVKWAALSGAVLAIVSIYLRFKEFPGLMFRWDANAYASTIWTILGLHLLHLIVLTIEDGLMTAYVFVHGLDDKHARDIRVTAVYWYWVVATWVILYAVVYLVPRMM